MLVLYRGAAGGVAIRGDIGGAAGVVRFDMKAPEAPVIDAGHAIAKGWVTEGVNVAYRTNKLVEKEIWCRCTMVCAAPLCCRHLSCCLLFAM